MSIFNDPGVYVVRSTKPTPPTPVIPSLPMAVIGPMYQVVDQEVDGDTGVALSADEMAKDEAERVELTIPYPALISEEQEVDTESVVVKAIRRDGREADLTEVASVTATGVTVDYGDATTYQLLSDLNDEWGGKSADGNYAGIDEVTIYVFYRALRADLVGQVLAAQGTDGVLATIGKGSPENPLGLAGMIAAGQTGTGMYFVPTPEDVDSYIDEALSQLEPLHVYAPVVLSDNPITHQKVISHVDRMSQDDERKWRFAWTYKPIKTRDELEADASSGITPTSSTQEVKIKQVEELVAYASSIYNQRAAVIFHDFITEIDGEDVELPGYYLAVAYAALKSQLPSQQGLTNYPVGGLVKKLLYANDYFKPSQLSQLSQGGVFVCTQATESAPIRSRFQTTTNTTNNKTKQVSLIYAVDDYSYGYIATLESYIGVRNVTSDTLDEIRLATGAYNNARRGAGLILSAALTLLQQNADDASQVDVEVDATFPTPLDRIVLRLRY